MTTPHTTNPHQPSSFRPTADGSPTPAQQPRWRLERATHGRLDLIDAAGQRHVDVDVLRAFPASAPAGPVAVVAADGTELAWIDPLSDLDEPLRGLLEQELSQREFLPVIERVESVSDGEPMEWSVLTDRGLRRFTVGHIDDIVYAPDGSVSITDSVGVRYAIPQLSRLDSRSRRLLDRLD